MDLNDDTLIVDFYVVFMSSRLDSFVMRMLDPHFQHCVVVKESEGGQFWVVIDSKHEHLDVRIESKLNYPHIRTLYPDCTIIPVRAKIKKDHARWTLCVINCVEICKAALGIRSFWTWTPRQLYDYLRSENGRHT